MQSVARFELISENQYTHDFSGFETRLSLSEIPIPRRATEGSAGYDFACPVAVTLLPGRCG